MAAELSDGPGWYMWEGRIHYKDGPYPTSGTLRWIVRVYWGDITKQWYAEESRILYRGYVYYGFRPVSMMVGTWRKLDIIE